MPDWITHVLVAWTLVTVLGFRYKQFSQSNAAIVVLGALIPDIYKITLILDPFRVYMDSFLTPIHLPIGSLLIAATFSLFFVKSKSIFLFLILGIGTHFALDLLLFGAGMELLYPLSPLKFEIGIISVTDYSITIISIVLALIVFFIYKKVNNTNNSYKFDKID